MRPEGARGLLRMKIDTHEFADADALAHALARAVAGDLVRAIAARGTALLAVSGGRTPLKFFRTLAQQALAWDKVTVTLVDERWVPPEHERSNARLVQANLLQGVAAAARFVPLFEAAFADPEQALSVVVARIVMLDLPFDALVLGMGEDGHTASFFPGGDNLARATDPATPDFVLPMRAPDAGEPRITLTLPPIVDSRNLYLHIEGGHKRRVLWDAEHADAADRTLPVSNVLRNARAPLQVYWCA
jgi:6-phosphogluconolactonase